MNHDGKRYCLDANVLIQAWQKYYAPDFCADYWHLLDELGKQQKVFIPQLVEQEIARGEDDLSDWLKKSGISIRPITEQVAQCLKDIYAADPNHKLLVDNTKRRSLADPWVIAHALSEQAVVVTKEEKVTQMNSKKIKIPNVCDNMGVRWINDFEFVREVGISFSATL